MHADLVREYIDRAVNRRDASAVDELVAPGYRVSERRITEIRVLALEER